MSGGRVLVLAALVVIASVAFAGPARADDPLEEAARRYDRGVELVRRGDDRAALAEFEAAHKLSGRWEVLLNIGVTQKRLFQYGRAVRSLERFLAEGGDAVDAGKRRDVEAELAEIHQLVAELAVEVPGAPARIEVDGLDEGQTPLDRPLLLGPGRHTVRASRDGELPDEKSVDLVSGQRADLRLVPRPAPVVPTTARVTLRSRPAGASLVVDEAPVGVEPWTGELTRGGHTVIAELPGYRRTSQEVTVDAGQERTVTIDLIALPPPPVPLYRRRWVLATGAAVVIAAVATTYVISTRPEGPDVPVHWNPP